MVWKPHVDANVRYVATKARYKWNKLSRTNYVQIVHCTIVCRLNIAHISIHVVGCRETALLGEASQAAVKLTWASANISERHLASISFLKVFCICSVQQRFVYIICLFVFVLLNKDLVLHIFEL